MLYETFRHGWPGRLSQLCLSAYIYYDFHVEFTIEDEFVFKGSHLIVPAPLLKKIDGSSRCITHWH